VTWKNGTKEWYVEDELHREDGPAIVWKDGSSFWYVEGKRHRGGGLPAVDKYNGDREWYVEGKLHRLDGPAVEYVNGTKSWYVDGVEYTEDEFNIKKNMRNDLSPAFKELIQGLIF
jgi:hypothetical protein